MTELCDCSEHPFPHRHYVARAPNGNEVEVVETVVEDDGLVIRDPESGELIFEPTRSHIRSAP
jgi:hypothetical protein